MGYHFIKVINIESFKDLATAEVIHADALNETNHWLKIHEGKNHVENSIDKPVS